jgi:hypothetical protein
VQAAQLCSRQIVEQSSKLGLPQLTVSCESLLQGPTVDKQELDVGCGLLVVNLNLRAAPNTRALAFPFQHITLKSMAGGYAAVARERQV